MRRGMEEMCAFFTYVVLTSLGLMTVLSPVKNKMALTEAQLEAMDDLVHKLRGRCSPPAHALLMAAEAISKEDYDTAGSLFAREWDEDRAAEMTVLALWMMRRLVKHAPDAKLYPARAAALRMQLMDIRLSIARGEWCAHCGGQVQSIFEMADDHKSGHMDAPDNPTDDSWLEGIDLEGEAAHGN